LGYSRQTCFGVTAIFILSGMQEKTVLKMEARKTVSMFNAYVLRARPNIPLEAASSPPGTATRAILG